jgi:hypothetical protein
MLRPIGVPFALLQIVHLKEQYLCGEDNITYNSHLPCKAEHIDSNRNIALNCKTARILRINFKVFLKK